MIVSALVAVAFAQEDKDAQIVNFDSVIEGDGNYAWSYETSNGIKAAEKGVGGQEAQGGYSYTGPDGVLYSVQYVADANGFQPQGEHLPTEGPAPDHVLKTLEAIKANPPQDPEFSLDALNAAIARLQARGRK